MSKFHFVAPSQNAEFFAQCLAAILAGHGMSCAQIRVPIQDSDEEWIVQIEKIQPTLELEE